MSSNSANKECKDSGNESTEKESLGYQGNEQDRSSVDEECDEEVTVDSLAVDSERAVEVPLPDIVGGVEERAQLMEDQRKDETLKDIGE